MNRDFDNPHSSYNRISVYYGDWFIFKLKKSVKEDIVITQDYGLAAMAINKSSYVINQNGLI